MKQLEISENVCQHELKILVEEIELMFKILSIWSSKNDAVQEETFQLFAGRYLIGRRFGKKGNQN